MTSLTLESGERRTALIRLTEVAGENEIQRSVIARQLILSATPECGAVAAVTAITAERSFRSAPGCTRGRLHAREDTVRPGGDARGFTVVM
jgi:hypothetical protein